MTIDWTATSLPVDLTKLPGSNQALIRVTASDGFNSAQDQSNAVFTSATPSASTLPTKNVSFKSP